MFELVFLFGKVEHLTNDVIYSPEYSGRFRASVASNINLPVTML